jgi:Protein of unknown function (DUF1549)
MTKSRLITSALSIALAALQSPPTGAADAQNQGRPPAPPTKSTLLVDLPGPPPRHKAAAGATMFNIELKLVDLKEDPGVASLAIRVHQRNAGSKSFWKGKGHPFTSLQCTQCHSLPRTKDMSDRFKRLLTEAIMKQDVDLVEAFKLQTWVQVAKGVNVLASPTLGVTKGRKAVFELKSPRKVEYFERRNDGLFTLKHEKLETGVAIATTVQEVKNGNVRLNPLSVAVTAVKGREEIEGVSLPVGKPVLTTTSISTSILSKLGKSSVITIDSPRGGRILISVRVRYATRAESLLQKLRDDDDTVFVRRAYLDVKGRVPTAAEVREYLADKSPDKRKRLLDKLTKKK